MRNQENNSARPLDFANLGTQEKRNPINASMTADLITPFRDNGTALVVTPTGQVMNSKSRQLQELHAHSPTGQVNTQQIGLNQRSF